MMQVTWSGNCTGVCCASQLRPSRTAASIDAAPSESVRAATFVLPTCLLAPAEISSSSQALTGCTSASAPTRSSSGGPGNAGEGHLRGFDEYQTQRPCDEHVASHKERQQRFQNGCIRVVQSVVKGNLTWLTMVPTLRKGGQQCAQLQAHFARLVSLVDEHQEGRHPLDGRRRHCAVLGGLGDIPDGGPGHDGRLAASRDLQLHPPHSILLVASPVLKCRHHIRLRNPVLAHQCNKLRGITICH